MKEESGRCGFRCDLCMANRHNFCGLIHQLRTAEGWYRYHDFMIHPSKIICDGCHKSGRRIFKPDERFDRVCECVTAKGLESCAHCDNYPCDDLKYKMDACKIVLERYRGKIRNDEFQKYIAPYDPETNLERIRASIVKPEAT